jgi:hypothetical protein
MSNRYIGLAAILLLVMLTSGAVGSPSRQRTGNESPKFDFALIGDLPYRPGQGEKFDTMIDELNSEKVALTIHVGDIKSGSSRCDDEVYETEYARFNTFRQPLVYTPGDNEWTDCHRVAAGAYDPLERLAFLRVVFLRTRPIPRREASHRRLPKRRLSRECTVGDRRRDLRHGPCRGKQ